MKPWKVVLSRRAEKDLARASQQVSKAVVRTLQRLAINPRQTDIRKLATSDDEWRLRVGEWRVFFRFDDASHTIEVLRIRDRKEAYD